MSKYTFTFKKDDIFVEFITEDRDVVERQFQIWVANADEYAKKNSLNPKTNKSIESEEAKYSEPIKVEQPEPIKEEPIVIQEPVIEVEPEQPILQQAEPVESENVFDNASSLLKTINTIQNEQENPETSVAHETQTEATTDFGAVLEEKIENPTFEPAKTNDPIFLNLVNSKHTTDKFHYLMITAYYLSEFEKLERFSLKQINAKLMQNLSEIIDHAMLQDAINQGFIEIIPDLTGVAEVAEYRLTRSGEEFFATKIG